MKRLTASIINGLSFHTWSTKQRFLDSTIIDDVFRFPPTPGGLIEKFTDFSQKTPVTYTKNNYLHYFFLPISNLKENSIKGGFYLPENVAYM